jgi:hypothetical protein
MMVVADLGTAHTAEKLFGPIGASVVEAVGLFVIDALHLEAKETEASITNKLKRGTLPTTSFLACLSALEWDGVALEEI